jgi:hypothetical protein
MMSWWNLSVRSGCGFTQGVGLMRLIFHPSAAVEGKQRKKNQAFVISRKWRERH